MTEPNINIGLTWKHILLMFVPPVLVNLLAWVPNPLVKGDYLTWIGFFGNYAGGILGAIVALLIANSQTNIALKQVNEERVRWREEQEAKKREDENNKKTGIKIVEIFLYEEIRNNLERIHPSVLEGMGLINDGKIIGTYMHETTFVYEIYDKIKFDLLKLETQFVLEVIEVYKAFKILERNKEINMMKRDQIKYVLDRIHLWNDRL